MSHGHSRDSVRGGFPSSSFILPSVTTFVPSCLGTRLEYKRTNEAVLAATTVLMRRSRRRGPGQPVQPHREGRFVRPQPARHVPTGRKGMIAGRWPFCAFSRSHQPVRCWCHVFQNFFNLKAGDRWRGVLRDTGTALLARIADAIPSATAPAGIAWLQRRSDILVRPVWPARRRRAHRKAPTPRS